MLGRVLQIHADSRVPLSSGWLQLRSCHVHPAAPTSGRPDCSGQRGVESIGPVPQQGLGIAWPTPLRPQPGHRLGGISGDEHPPTRCRRPSASPRCRPARPEASDCSRTSRITMPFLAHGVTTSVVTTNDAGIRASIADTVSRVRATRPNSRDERSERVQVAPDGRHDEAAFAVGGQHDVGCRTPALRVRLRLWRST